MATQVRAQMASGRGVVGQQRCWGSPRRPFAPTNPGVRVVDGHRTRGIDFLGHILLWPPNYAHEWPVKAAWLGSRDVGGTPAVWLHAQHLVFSPWTPTVPMAGTLLDRYCYGHRGVGTNGKCKRRCSDAAILTRIMPFLGTQHTRWSRRGRPPSPWCGLIRPPTSVATQVRARMASARSADWMHKTLGSPAVGLHAPHPVVASWSPTVPVVRTSMARYFHGHPSKRTNGQCKRRGWVAQMLEVPPPSVFTIHTRRSRRECPQYPWFGLPWPVTPMATQLRARMASASRDFGMHKCWRDRFRRFARTTPGGCVVEAHRALGFDFYGQLLPWPPMYAQ